MARKKISQLESATDVTANDLIQIVDVEDGVMAPSGTNKKVTAQLLANELGKLTNVTATGSTTARSLANRFADVVNVKDFGAVGDGVADDTAAIAAAIAGGGRVIFPKGTYKINLTTVGGLVVPQGTVICGDGSSITELQMTSTQTGFVNLFNLSAGKCSIQDLKISWTTPAGSSGAIAFLFGAGSDISLCQLHVNMDVEEVGGARNAANQLFNVTGNSSRVRIENSFFEYFAFGILKTNTATHSNDDWLISGNTFENFFNPALTFNTPAGDWNNVRVIGNTLKNSLGHTAGQFEHMGGLAGGNGSGRFIFANNHFIGTGRGLNFEEGAEEVVISGNTFALTDTAIKILDNDVGGTARTPKRFVIDGNTMTKTGASVEAQTDIGIELIFGNTANPPLTEAVVGGNVITGYDRGISTAENVHACVIQGNIIKTCAVGIRLVEGNAEISGNTFLDCTVGINSTTNSGMVGKNTFHNTTTILQDSTGAGLGCEGMSIILDGYSLPAGSNQDVVLCPQGARMAARTAYHVRSNTANAYRVGAYDLTFDGSTLTTVGGGAVVSTGSGTLGTPSFVVDSGNLCLRITNSSGSAQPTNVKVSFDGPYFV